MLESSGIPPKIRDAFDTESARLDVIEAAIGGDFVFVVTAVDDPPAAGTGFDAITVKIEAKNAAGDVHTWFNKTITTTALAVTTAGNGTAAQVPATTCVMANGVGTVEVTGTATWAADDTFVVESAEATILGYTIAADSATVTCVA
jgi:hypothetical protein